MCCCSIPKCLTLWYPMDCNMSGFTVPHHLPEFALAHVHWIRDTIQPSHPLPPPSPFAFNLSQHQGLFQWVSSSYQVAKVFEPQPQSFQSIFRVDFLYDWLVWSPYSPRDSHESSPELQFESINSSALSPLHSPTFTSVHDYWKNIALTRWTFVSKVKFSTF